MFLEFIILINMANKLNSNVVESIISKCILFLFLAEVYMLVTYMSDIVNLYEFNLSENFVEIIETN